MVNFKSIKINEMKKVLKEVTADNGYTWKIERRVDGLFITNNYFTNNENIEEGFRVFECEEGVLKAELRYSKNGETTYNSSVNIWLIEDSKWADLKEFNLEAFERVARSCKNYFNNRV